MDEPNPSGAATAATASVNITGAEQTGMVNSTITVPGSGFESPSMGSGLSAYQYSPAGGSWTFTGAGVSGNGSGFTFGNPAAPEGQQLAFLQGGPTSSITQMLAGFQAGGSYTVQFLAAQRGNVSNGGEDFDVYLDFTLLGTFRPGSTSYGALSTPAFTTSAGAHTLKFVGRNSAGGDNTALIDAVRVTGTAPISDSGTVSVSINGGTLTPTLMASLYHCR